MISEEEIFQRTGRLIGAEGLQRLQTASAIIFGVGGVGSWCAESLVRSGVRRLTMVDPDTVQASNINRQLPATVLTLGRPKVDVLRERLQSINPSALITALPEAYSPDNAAGFRLSDYDYVIDAIDSLEAKAHLLRTAADAGARVFASMGAALKMDPQKIRVAEFWKVRGCPLAAALRRKFKKQHLFPAVRYIAFIARNCCPTWALAPKTPVRKPASTVPWLMR